MRSAVDSATFHARVEKLRKFEDGWLDGQGKKPDAQLLDLIEKEVVACGMPIPYLFPTVDGGVFLEWSTKDHPSLTVFFSAGDVFGFFHSWKYDVRTYRPLTSEAWKEVAVFVSECPETSTWRMNMQRKGKVDARFFAGVLLQVAERFNDPSLTTEQFEKIRQKTAEIEQIVIEPTASKEKNDGTNDL